MSPREAIVRGQQFNAATRSTPTSPPFTAAAAIVPRLLSVPDAARYAGASPRQLRYWIDAGVLRRVKLGRSVKIDRQQLDAAIDRAMRGHDLPSRPPTRPKATPPAPRPDPVPVEPRAPASSGFAVHEAQP